MCVIVMLAVVVAAFGQQGVMGVRREGRVTDVARPMEEATQDDVRLTLAQHSQALQLLLNATTRLLTKDRECAPPFRRVMNECFFMGTNFLSWEEARHHCRGMGGDLAAPEHLYALKSYIKEKTYFWLGGAKDEQEGQWHWVTGEALRPGDWCRGTPEHVEEGSSCLYLNTACHPPLHSGSCFGTRTYICQYHP